MKNKTVLNKDFIIKGDRLIFKYYFFPLICIFEVVAAVFILFLLYLENYIVSGIFILLMIGLPILITLLVKKRTKQTIYQIFSKDRQIVYLYEFNENNIKLNVQVGNGNKEYVFNNKDLIRVVEDEQNIFLFVQKAMVYIIDKKGFDNFDKLTFKSLFFDKTKFIEL